MQNLEQNIKNQGVSIDNEFENTKNVSKRDKNYVLELSDISDTGFKIDIYSIEDDSKQPSGEMNISYTSRGPGSFLPVFNSTLTRNEKYELSREAVGFAMETVKTRSAYDKFRLLLHNDFDQITVDKGKFDLTVFEVIAKMYDMNWQETNQGQEYVKEL